MGPPPGKLGKLVHPACQHSPHAKAFLVSHLVWQDRVRSEQAADFNVAGLGASQEQVKPPRKCQSMTALELARSEYHPIGGCSQHNNNSGQISLTLGPKSWQASGGLKSEYRQAVGNMSIPLLGASPHMSASMSSSYLPKAVRNEGRKRAHADQVEAIRQHGEDTILGLKRGDIHANNPAEQQVFRGSAASAGGRREQVVSSRGGSARSRQSDISWGSIRSNPEEEIRRIHELGDKAREIGKKNAAVHQVGALQQHGEKTIIGLAQGAIPAANAVEDKLLAHSDGRAARPRTYKD